MSTSVSDRAADNNSAATPSGVIEALADPLRLRLLRMLYSDPASVKELGLRLGLAANRLYYHLGLLQRAGLIVIDGYRPSSRGAERVYRAIETDGDVEMSPRDGHLVALALFETARGELLRSAAHAATEPDDSTDKLLCRYLRVAVPADTWAEFLTEVNVLCDRLAGADADAEAKARGPKTHTVLLTAYEATEEEP